MPFMHRMHGSGGVRGEAGRDSSGLGGGVAAVPAARAGGRAAAARHGVHLPVRDGAALARHPEQRARPVHGRAADLRRDGASALSDSGRLRVRPVPGSCRFWFQPPSWLARFCLGWVWRSTPAQSANLRPRRRLSRHRVGTKSRTLWGEAQCSLVDLAQFRCSWSALWRWRRRAAVGFDRHRLEFAVEHGHRLRQRAGRARRNGARAAAGRQGDELRRNGVGRHRRAVRGSTGAATVAPGTATTDATGQAKAQVTLGSSAGNVTISATVAGSSISRNVRRHGGHVDQTLACSSGAPQTPAAGGVLPGVSGTGICLGAAAGGSDYAARRVLRQSEPRHTRPGERHGARRDGARDAGPRAARRRLRDTAARTRSRQRAATKRRSSSTCGFAESAQTQLAPLVPGARAAMRSGARFNAIPSSLTLDQIVTLNANGVGSVQQPDQRRRARRGDLEHGDRPRRHGESARADSPTRSMRRSRRRSTR